ncbi:MAG: Ig-like domain repeat protein, partial [Candidatus Acidiferrales bacterium]
MSSLRQGLALSVLIITINLLGSPANPQIREQLSKSIDDAGYLRIDHSQPLLATPANDVGRVEAGRAMQRMLLVLSPAAEQQNQLKQLLDDQQNRKSPQYHRWLSASEFAAKFGVADADVEKAKQWLQGRGFTVAQIAKGRRWVEFSGTSQQVESAFQTELHYYKVGEQKYVANATDIAIPNALAEISGGVVSLNSFGKRPPRRIVAGTTGSGPATLHGGLRPQLTYTGATNAYYVAPGDFAAIYNTKPLLSSGIDGTGVAIAVTAQSQFELTDVQTFRQIFKLGTNDPNILVVGPYPGFSNPTDAEEALLDTEWAGAVAPGATIDVVIAGSTDTTSGVDLAAAYAIDNEIAPILTYTYGGCEAALGPTGNAFYNVLWQQAAAEGITVLVAAGDNGAAGCDNPNSGLPASHGFAVNGAAATPYNMAVGGTQFADQGNEATYWNTTDASDYSSAIGYIPEAAWNDSCDPWQAASATNCLYGNGNFSLLAGGGGASSVYTKPPWQTGTGVPADGARDVPDVALAAGSGHDNIVYCTSHVGAGPACQIDGQNNLVGLTLVGGTSAATPAMAGILALVEQQNGVLQGQVNYVLYQLAQNQSCDASQQTNPTAQNSCVFYDVTAGSNAVPCAGGTLGCSSTQSGVNGFLNGQSAGTGYDLATGLGSVNAANLASNWKNASFAGSQTSMQASSASFVHGTSVNVSGMVAPANGNGTPTGMVSLKTDLFGDADSLPLTNGAFTAAVSDLPGGQYKLSAHYAGDATFAASDSPVLLLNVQPEPSTTLISLSGVQGGSADYGAAVTVRVTVAGASGSGMATGAVTLQDGTTLVGTYALTPDGSAYMPTGNGGKYSFGVGAHTLTATYAGDNSFTGSASAPANFSIGKGTPFVVVGANAANVSVGQSVGIHAVVSGSGTQAATGTIQFTDNGAPIGTTVPLQAGGFFGTQAQASMIASNLAVGAHILGASYDGSGDANYASVPSGDQNESPFAVNVSANAGTKTSTTTLTPVTLPATLGSTGSFRVAVAPSGSNGVTGAVTLWDAVGPRSTSVGLGMDGTAQITIPWTQAGNATLYAQYTGDANYGASASAPPLAFSVSKGTPTVTLNAPSTANANQQVSVNVSVAGIPGNVALAYPTGVVEFWDSLNGGAAQLIAAQSLTVGAGNVSVFAIRKAFAPGVHSLKVRYRGDNNWQATDSASQPLTTGDFSVTVSPNPVAIVAGSAGTATVTITASGSFTGTINLKCPTGTTILPAGYACSFSSSSVTIAAGQTTGTTQLQLTPTTTVAGAASRTVSSAGTANGWMVFGLMGGMGLLGLAVLGTGGKKIARRVAFVSGWTVCV